MPDKSDEELAEQIISKVSPKQKEKICAEATAELFRTIQQKGKIKWDSSKEKKDLLLAIARIARLSAHIRGYVNEDGFPSIEKPDRINYLLYNLARGHALLCGRNYINESDLPLVIEVALASTTIQKAKIVKLLLQREGCVTTTEVKSVYIAHDPLQLST
jgi:MoxR-like ATPase